MDRIPRRLKRDPILEAVAECRFQSERTGNAAAILPGFLYQQLRGEFPNLEALPESQIPAQVRARDSDLKYRAVYRLRGANKAILVGDQSLCVTVNEPYPGWDTFKPLVASVWRLLENSGVVGSIERISTKYTNLIEAELGTDHFALTNLGITVGQQRLSSQPTQLQSEFSEGPLVTIVQAIGQATATAGASKPRHGLVLVVDTIVKGPFDDFWKRFENLLEQAHSKEKQTFFELLTNETLRKYEPEY
jgi:uncharacterized protein (TIGR04255 family)